MYRSSLIAYLHVRALSINSNNWCGHLNQLLEEHIEKIVIIISKNITIQYSPNISLQVFHLTNSILRIHNFKYYHHQLIKVLQYNP